jgi:hypothetical protein
VSADRPAAPALRIVRGNPGAEEIAAVVAVLASAYGAAGADQPGQGEVSHWAAPSRLMRPAVAPTGWWASALPR